MSLPNLQNLLFYNCNFQNSSFTIDKHPLHNWMSQSRGGNEKASLSNLQNWQNPFQNSSSKLMVLKVLPPVCPATCESNLMAINGAPLSSRYHPLQYNALYAQRKMWPTGCEWCPSWEHQHVIWIRHTLLISFKTETHKTYVQIWNVKSKNCTVMWRRRQWWLIRSDQRGHDGWFVPDGQSGCQLAGPEHTRSTLDL